ncbi:MAG: hypothetical protein WC879_00255 [Melioribacteraceae bacterium]
MKKLILTAVLAVCTMAFAIAQERNVTFYKVPLVCGAAPQIGCGGKAKPVLLGLEKKNNVVNEAWLNRAGTVIAIVWKDNVSTELQTATADAIFKENKLDVEEVKGKEYKKLLKEFQSGKDWLRGAEVDKLSEEEAGIIAERLVKRINDKAPLTEEKKQNLKKEFADVFKKRFSKNYGSEINSDENKAVEKFKTKAEGELTEVAKKYLNETEMAAFNDAIAQGLRPTENEKKDSKRMLRP